jgi:fructan beta-fructosidase
MLALSTLAADTPRSDLVVADFEGETYGDWEVSGTAFGTGPARGTLPNQMPVSGFRGHGLVNSYSGGDGTTGRLLSPGFRVERRFIRFLIGGGQYPDTACIRLLHGDRVVRTATGPNDRPGGTERLTWHTWTVDDLLGEEVRIEILDEATGGWGHINIDHIIQSDLDEEPSMTFTCERPHLCIPIQNGAPMEFAELVIDGKAVRFFDLELARDQVDFWTFLDLRPFSGREAAFRIGALPGDAPLLTRVHQADTFPGQEDLYREPLRPRFHFSSRRGWINDPNGLVYLDGEYHLFYQHNPYGVGWGNMHWGHAVSPDLVHWRELPIALYPRGPGDMCFSGSAVADTHNTTGLSRGGEPVLVAAYTSTARGECLAYSPDRGRTWKEKPGNPVVTHSGRDPKLVWHDPTQRWIMAVYDEQPEPDTPEPGRYIAFYSSSDMETWEFESRIKGFYECPELFELRFEDEPEASRWVVFGADGEYLLGTFDGHSFTPTEERQRLHHGNCFYASQTFNNVPTADGRRILMAWGTVAFPGMPFNQMMTFPVSLTLARNATDTPRIRVRPVRELASVHARESTWTPSTLPPPGTPLPGLQGGEFHIVLRTSETAQAGRVRLGLGTVDLVLDLDRGTLTCGPCTAPLPGTAQAMDLEILVDRGSIEAFAAQGLLYMPVGAVADTPDRPITCALENGAGLESLSVWELRSAWE